MKKLFDDFDVYASDYRAIHTRNIKLTGADSYYFVKAKVQHMAGYEAANPLRFLDVGCGDGATEEFISSVFRNWQMTGIDISARSIEEAAKRNIPGAVFYTYDGVRFPFEAHTFDIVFMAGVLHHVSKETQYKLLSEAYRVLVPGGRLYIFEHNPWNPFTRYLVRTCVFDRHAKLLSAATVISMIKKCNFQQRIRKYITFFPLRGLLAKLVRIEKYLAWLPLGGQYFIRAVKRVENL